LEKKGSARRQIFFVGGKKDQIERWTDLVDVSAKRLGGMKRTQNRREGPIVFGRAREVWREKKRGGNRQGRREKEERTTAAYSRHTRRVAKGRIGCFSDHFTDEGRKPFGEKSHHHHIRQKAEARKKTLGSRLWKELKGLSEKGVKKGQAWFREAPRVESEKVAKGAETGRTWGVATKAQPFPNQAKICTANPLPRKEAKGKRLQMRKKEFVEGGEELHRLGGEKSERKP